MYKRILTTALFAAVGLATGAYIKMKETAAKEADNAVVFLAWYKGAREAGCKPINYIPNGVDDFRVVWMCPDGRALLQPKGPLPL